MELKDLAGEHTLDYSAVGIANPFNHEGNGIAFFLSGMAYLALENPDDGYRSHMGAILSTKATAYGLGISNYERLNRPVVCRHLEKSGDDECDILEIIDKQTSHVWLRVGTDNTDDYYPYFVSEWKAMSPETVTA